MLRILMLRILMCDEVDFWHCDAWEFWRSVKPMRSKESKSQLTFQIRCGLRVHNVWKLWTRRQVLRKVSEAAKGLMLGRLWWWGWLCCTHRPPYEYKLLGSAVEWVKHITNVELKRSTLKQLCPYENVLGFLLERLE
jgi:hypothetical protein